jgi:1-acyl-sn-glycerol-3-phosphate acyltransferase
MADAIKSFLTWFFGSLFLILMYPVSILLWLMLQPLGISEDIVHRWATFQCRVLVKLIPLWKVTYIKGTGKITEPHIIIANHQSILDVPVLHQLGGQFRWVSKIELFKFPIVGSTMRIAGYIPLDRGNPESIARMMNLAESAIIDGKSVVMFPEGTRSRNGIPLKFKSGAFKLALKSGVPILPVVIDGTSEVLPKKGMVFSSGHRITIKVLEPVRVEDFISDDPVKLAEWFRDVLVDELKSLRENKPEP